VGLVIEDDDPEPNVDCDIEDDVVNVAHPLIELDDDVEEEEEEEDDDDDDDDDDDKVEAWSNASGWDIAKSVTDRTGNGARDDVAPIMFEGDIEREDDDDGNGGRVGTGVNTDTSIIMLLSLLLLSILLLLGLFLLEDVLLLLSLSLVFLLSSTGSSFERCTVDGGSCFLTLIGASFFSCLDRDAVPPPPNTDFRSLLPSPPENDGTNGGSSSSS
jgi:hypothetical protein